MNDKDKIYWKRCWVWGLTTEGWTKSNRMRSWLGAFEGGLHITDEQDIANEILLVIGEVLDES